MPRHLGPLFLQQCTTLLRGAFHDWPDALVCADATCLVRQDLSSLLLLSLR